jgi:hypothetical protein
MSLADSYVTEIRRELKRFGTWEPGVPMELGDFGTLNGALFTRMGNLRDLKIAFAKRTDPSQKEVSYTSKGAVEMDFGAGASVDVGPAANVRAALKVTFRREHAVLFNAAGVSYESVADQIELEKRLLRAIEAGDWEPPWAAVTELMRSTSTTVAVSTAANASLMLEAKGDVPQIDLAKADIRLAVRSERNIGYKAVTAAGMTPLLGISRIRPRGLFWWRQTKLRRELGFEPDADTPKIDKVPGDFQSRLEAEVESVLDEVRAGGVSMDEAFEWASLQPSERP